MVAVLLGFCKAPQEWWNSFETFFFLACSSARIFFSISFVLHAIFSSNKRFQEFFFKITHPPPLPPQELMVGPKDARNSLPRPSCSHARTTGWDVMFTWAKKSLEFGSELNLKLLAKRGKVWGSILFTCSTNKGIPLWRFLLVSTIPRTAVSLDRWLFESDKLFTTVGNELGRIFSLLTHR